MQHRLNLLANQIDTHPTINYGRKTEKSDDDIVIIGFGRTAMCRAKKGAFRDTALEQMMVPVLNTCIDMAGIKKD